mgnify:CR=1 FL=1
MWLKMFHWKYLGVGTDSKAYTYSGTISVDAAGNAYINVGNSTAGGGTYALTATISGGTASGATGSGSFTVVDTTSTWRSSSLPFS